MYFLWQQLGSSCLAGIAVMIIVMPVTRSVAQGIAKLQKGTQRVASIMEVYDIAAVPNNTPCELLNQKDS